MKSLLKFCTILAVGLGAGAASLAADLALVITNTDYDRLGRIRDGDANLRALLRAYDTDGYTVLTGRNMRATEMAELLAQFEDKAAEADRLVIHFTGHALASRQNLRLAPRDMGEGTLVGAHYAAPSLDLLYELVDHRPGRAAIVIATPDVGVGAAISAGPHIPQGVLVLSGVPRSLNRFVEEDFLGDHVAAADIDPRGGVSAAGYISDQALAPADEPAPTLALPTASDELAREMQAWRNAAQNGTRGALEDYLRRYPNGLFAREAQARLAALEPQVSPEEQIETALALTRAQRRAIQENLTLLGFDTRGVDGIFGAGTRRAVGAWQRSLGFRETGFLDRAQIRVLEDAARNKQAELKAQAEADRAQRDREDLAFWQNTGSSGQAADLREYLRRFPEGLFAPQAQRMLDQLEPPVDQQALARENALNMNGQTRILVEQRLAGLNLDPGPVDGQFDAQTRNAIRAFQSGRNLPVTGYLDSQTVGQLIVSIISR